MSIGLVIKDRAEIGAEITWIISKYSKKTQKFMPSFSLKGLRLPKFARNFYFIFGASFLLWMLLFDSNDYLTQWRRSQKIKQLEKEKRYYQEAVEIVKQERAELLTNPELLEKFAREKYLMRRPQEDLYILIEE
jgi:cell division protein FtsB